MPVTRIVPESASNALINEVLACVGRTKTVIHFLKCADIVVDIYVETTPLSYVSAFSFPYY